MSSLTVPGHPSFPSSLGHQVFSLHPSLWHLSIVVCFGPVPILALPLFFLAPPLFFFWVSCAHASGDLELSLLVLPLSIGVVSTPGSVYYFKGFHCHAVLVVGILLNILVNLSFFPFFLTAFLSYLL